MPMMKGSRKSVVARNIREFHTGATYARTKRRYGAKVANRQAVAAAMAMKRRSGRKGSRS